MPWLVIFSITSSETLEDAAPTTTSAFLEMRLSTDCEAIGFWASPESECTTFTSLPSPTPPSFMSLTDRSTAANSGGPRTDSEPVCGSSLQTVKVQSGSAPCRERVSQYV